MRDWPIQPTPHHRRVVFLDRDGTINVDTHYPYQIESLEFIPGVLRALAILAKLPLDIIVVSNQAGISLGMFTYKQMSEFNRELCSRVEQAEGRIDAFYFCPHREPKDLPPGSPRCMCAKPAPGMLLEAAEDFQLDLPKSFLIGDKTSDIAAGESVGCLTILVETGKAGKEEGAMPIKPKYVVSDLYEAAKIVQSILQLEPASRFGKTSFRVTDCIS